MLLLDKDFELNKSYLIEDTGFALPENIFLTFFKDQWRHLEKPPEFYEKMLEVVGPEIDSREFEYEMETFKGDIQQRILKYMYFNNASVPWWEKERLSEFVTSLRSDKLKKLNIKLSWEIDWEPGTFYESSSSCWWDDYQAGRMQFMAFAKKGKAFAMRIYDEKGFPFGRCFGVFYPGTSNFILFNIYTKRGYCQYDVLNLLMSHFKTNYQRIELEFNSWSTIFVNGTTGYYFGTTPIPSYVEIDVERYYRDNSEIEQYVYLTDDEDYDDDEDYYEEEDYETEICPSCNSEVREGSVFFLKPQKIVICYNCRYRHSNRNPLATTATTEEGHYIHYDRNYYHFSSKSHKIVKTKGKQWVQPQT